MYIQNSQGFHRIYIECSSILVISTYVAVLLYNYTKTLFIQVNSFEIGNFWKDVPYSRLELT